MMKKRSYYDILINLRVKQNHTIQSQKKVKEDVLNSARALLKVREMVF